MAVRLRLLAVRLACAGAEHDSVPDIYDGPDLVSGSLSLWDFTATLELRERPILDPGWTILPEFILHPDIFDIAMNREWPEA